MSESGAAEQGLSARLQRAIEGGCHMMDDLVIGSLVKTIRGGGSPWFVEEFGEAIRSGALTPHIWGVLTHTDLDDDDYEQTEADLRYVWSQVAPETPYPGEK
jgi:hypothetical protein